MIFRKPLFLISFLIGFACSEDTLNRLSQSGEKPNVSSFEDASQSLDQGLRETDAGDFNNRDASSGDQGNAYVRDAEMPDTGIKADSGEHPDASTPLRECYTETFDPTVNISDLESDYRRRRRSGFRTIMEALRRRYPAGHALLVAEQNDPYTGSFVDTSSFGTVMESSMTEVHEATHGWDYGHSLFRVHFDFWLRDDLQHSLSFNIDGGARSQIYSMLEDNSTDLYARTYLTGEQGTRGFLELLDETNCYINGLGAITAIGDQVPYGISGRDGAVAFLYYIQLYLRYVRTNDPQLYAQMQSDTDLVEHIKVQWLRAHFFLMFADQEPQIGIRDADIRMNLYASHNLFEISNLIGRCVDTTNCLCD